MPAKGFVCASPFQRGCGPSCPQEAQPHPPLVEASPRDNHSACRHQNPEACPTSTEDTTPSCVREDPGPRRTPARLWGGKDALTPRAETPAGQGRNHSVCLQRCARHPSDSETPRQAGGSPCSHGTSLLSEKRHERINKRLIISIPEKTGPGKGRARREGVVRTGQGGEG